jgi:hypothetical protein
LSNSLPDDSSPNTVIDDDGLPDGEIPHENTSDEEAIEKFVSYNFDTHKYLLSEDAQSSLTSDQLTLANDLISYSNVHIAADIAAGNTFIVHDPQTGSVYQYLEGKYVIPIEARYKEGKTAKTWHWNYVRIYIKKTTANKVIAAGATGALASVISYKQARYIINKHFSTPLKGGIYFDVNYGGLAAVGVSIALGEPLVAVAVTALNGVVTKCGYQ